MKQFLHNFKLKLTAISSAHIGDGEIYEPTNYVIDGGNLYYFDDTVLISMLTDEQQKDLMKIVSQPNSYRQLQLFYKREDIKKLAKSCALYSVPVAKDIENNYNESLGRVKQKEGKGNEVFNALSIDSTIKTSHIPYIPGSSFKGALKTAFFSKEAQNRDFSEVAKEKMFRGEFRDYLFDNRFFGQFEKDPFSKLKISDFIPKEPRLEIKWGVNKKKKSDTTENDNTGVRYEFIAPASEFVAEMTLMDLLEEKEIERINKQIRDYKKHLHQPQKVYAMQEIIETANSFYIPKFEEEQRWAESKKNHLINPDYFKRALPFIQKAKKGQGFLIRVGRHSGAVSMTLDKHRKIFIPQMKKDAQGNPLSPKQKYVSSPFTYWLASNVDAVKSAEFIGWFYCEVTTDEEYQATFRAYEEQYQKQVEQLSTVKKQICEKEAQVREAKEAKRRQKEIEELQKIEQKKEEEAKLAAMSPVERKIAQLQKENPNPNETIDIVIFNALKNGHLDDVKCEALQILKKEMITLKKWVENSKKPEKDKKYKRTQEVIQMLGKCQ